jgi:VanZ family protein
MKKMFQLWFPAALWACLIFSLSSIPGLSSGLQYDYLLRKMAHITEYAILTFLLYRAFEGTFKLSSFQLFFYPVTVAYFYAVSDEFHQLFVHARHGAFEDTLIDAIGILGFYILKSLIERKVGRKS